MTHINRHKTLIIAIWIGKWPSYLPYFAKSIGCNTDFDWLLISDQNKCPYTAENLLFKHIATENLSELITEKLGIAVNISNPLKLCDLKPAYGFIFNDQLVNYDYWGFCDLDLIPGNLIKYIQPLYEADKDVISFYKSFLSGPLCLFKNSPLTIDLFKKIHRYKEFLMDPAHLAMDENNKLKMAEIARFSNLKSRIQYIKHVAFNEKLNKIRIPEFRYRYQWFNKRKANSLHPPYDMTDVVFQEEAKEGLSTHFEDFIYSDRAYKRTRQNNWTIRWENGKLYELHKNREIPVFHFVDLKNNLSKPGTDHIDLISGFSVNKDGFY